MIPAPVRYLRASSLDEALEALAEPDSRALAGGQSLVSVMKLRIARPSLVVDIGRLGLAGVTAENGELEIGALTTWAELAAAPELDRPALAALRECAEGIGDLQVRNRGTVGGSLAHADPASDLPAVLLALDASVRARSTSGERTLRVDELLVGPFTTSLTPGELLIGIAIRTPEPGSGSAYRAVEHPASGFALAGAAAIVRPDGETAVAVTGIGSTPFGLAEGEPEEALAAAEVFGDRFAPVEYRRDLAGVVARRALEAASARAEEDTTWRT
jgi:carbon-monoxide dehydrogenase medium subunit